MAVDRFTRAGFAEQQSGPHLVQGRETSTKDGIRTQGRRPWSATSRTRQWLGKTFRCVSTTRSSWVSRASVLFKRPDGVVATDDRSDLWARWGCGGKWRPGLPAAGQDRSPCTRGRAARQFRRWAANRRQTSRQRQSISRRLSRQLAGGAGSPLPRRVPHRPRHPPKRRNHHLRSRLGRHRQRRLQLLRLSHRPRRRRRSNSRPHRPTPAGRRA